MGSQLQRRGGPANGEAAETAHDQCAPTDQPCTEHVSTAPAVDRLAAPLLACLCAVVLQIFHVALPSVILDNLWLAVFVPLMVVIAVVDGSGVTAETTGQRSSTTGWRVGSQSRPAVGIMQSSRPTRSSRVEY